MTDSPSVTWPSPAMTTLSSRRTQRTVVERMRRGVGLSAVLSVATATSGFLIMSAILNYSSAGDAIVCEALNLKKQVERLYSRDLEEDLWPSQHVSRRRVSV